MKEYSPLISISLPYYNDQEYIRDSIESILTQSYTNFELILINHSSTDDSIKIAHSFDDKRIIHTTVSPNTGAGGAILFKEFYKLASGEYLKLFCADDILFPNALERMIEELTANPEIDIMFSDMEYIDVNGKPIDASWYTERTHFKQSYNEIEIIKCYLKGYSILPYSTNIFKKSVVNTSILDDSLIMMFDMSLWLSMLCKGAKIKLLDYTNCLYRVGKQQVAARYTAELANTRSSFESLVFSEMFYKLKSKELCKKICFDSIYFDFIDNASNWELDFILAHYIMSKKYFVGKK